MISRRRFLSLAGTLAATTPLVRASDTGGRRGRWELIAHDEPLVVPATVPEPASWSDDTITAAWIGHSTVLVNFFGFHIITDPVFSERIGLSLGGLGTIGPKRLVTPALMAEQLPPLDLILLSHAHMDHLDIPSLKELDRSIPVVIAENTYDVIQDLDYTTVYELDWGEWTRIGDLRIEALEVNHFGWRYPWERDRSRGYRDGRSYNAYLLSHNGHHVVFGGDTSYHEKFNQIRQRGIPVDLAIMPIGAYDPWITAHADPEQALAMADHMGADTILPIHWKTFIQSQEPTTEPIERLQRAIGDRADRIALSDIGETWTLQTTPEL